MMENRHLIDDNGFSLVEMIVSILVTAIIMFGVGVFISTTRGTYQMVSTSAKLQEESISMQNLVSELVMEATNYGTKQYNNLVCVNGLGESFEGDVYVQCIEAKDNEQSSKIAPKCYYLFIFSKKKGEETGTIHYSKIADTDDCSKVAISAAHTLSFTDSTVENKYIEKAIANRYTLVADCVKDMRFTCSTAQTNGYLIHMESTYSFMDTDFVSDINLLTRNKLGSTT